jgi:hypothetical protein
MTVEQLRGLRLASPFRPFDLVIEGGRRIAVKQPYHMAISPVGNAFLVTTGDDGVEFLKPAWVKDVVMHSAEASGATQRAPDTRESA